MGISLRDFLNAGKEAKPAPLTVPMATPAAAPAPSDPGATGPLFSVPRNPGPAFWPAVESVHPVSTFRAEEPPVPPTRRIAAPTVASESTGAAPNQAARRAEQSARPLIESVDLPFGAQRDLNAAAQGATFGFSDELAAGLRSLRGEKYDDAIAAERGGLAKFRAEHPTRAFVDELLGGAASTVPLGGIAGGAKAATTLGRIGQAATTGAFAGGISGAGSAEGGIPERAVGMLKGAAVGGVLGGALGTAAEGVRRIPNFRETPDVAANRLLVEALRRDDMSVNDALMAAKGFTDTKPAVVLDLGKRNTQRLGRSVRSQPGKGSAALDEALTQRGLGGEERTINDVIATTGLGGRQNAFQKAEQLIAEQKANAKPLYEKAYAGPDISDPEVVGLLKDPDFQAAYNRGARIAKKEGIEFPALSDDQQAASMPVQAFDYMKRGLDDVIESKSKTGGMGANEARVLRNQLRDARARVDATNPDYAAARARFAGDADLQDAFEAGRKLFKAHPDETTLALNGMGAGEKELFRRGALESLADRIENRMPGRNPADVAAKTMDKKRLRMLFDSPDQFAEFQKRLGEEATMHRTKAAVQGGSNSIDKAAELLDLAGLPTDLALHAVTGHGGLIKRGLKAVAGKVTGGVRSRTMEANADELSTRMTAGLGDRQDLVDMLNAAQASTATRAARPVSQGANAVAGATQFVAPRVAIPSSLTAPDVRSLGSVSLEDRDAEERRRLFAQFLRSGGSP